jgi:hypothetical protein
MWDFKEKEGYTMAFSSPDLALGLGGDRAILGDIRC